MLIAVIAEDFPPNQGGIADYAGNLVNVLVSAGHQVKVVSAHVTGDKEIDSKIEAPIRRVGKLDIRRKKLGLLKRIKAVRQMNAQVGSWIDDAFSEAAPDFAILMSVTTWADACINRNIPYIVCVHGGDAFGKRADFIRSFYRKLVVRKILSNAVCVAANSMFIKSQLINFGVNENIIIITHCGVDEKFLKIVNDSDIQALPDKLDGRLLMVCRLVKFKACDVVLKAISILEEQYPGIMLTIAGDGPERQSLERLASQLDIQNNVRFLGYVKEIKQKVELFKENEIFVLSGRFDPEAGRQETFGIVFAEAGACRRPVIGPNIGGVPEAIKDNVSGYLVEPDNVESMVKQIERYLLNPSSASKMGIAGRQRVEQVFNYPRIADLLVSSMLKKIDTVEY